MAHVQDKKDALVTLIEIERNNLHSSLDALRATAREVVAELRERVQHLRDKVDVKSAIVAHRYQLLFGAFAIGIAFGIKRIIRD